MTRELLFGHPWSKDGVFLFVFSVVEKQGLSKAIARYIIATSAYLFTISTIHVDG